MKKYLILLTAIILALVLVACNGKDKPDETSAQDVTTVTDETTIEETTAEETTVEETTAPDVDLSSDDLKVTLLSSFAKSDAITKGRITMITNMSTSYDNDGEQVTENDEEKLIFTIDGTNISIISDPLVTNYILVGNKLYIEDYDFMTETPVKYSTELSLEQMAEFLENYIMDEKPSFDLIDMESLETLAGMFAAKKHADGSVSISAPQITNEIIAAIIGAGDSDAEGIPTDMLQINPDTFKFNVEVDKDGYLALIDIQLDVSINIFGSVMNMGTKMNMAIETEGDFTVTEPADKDQYTAVTYDEIIDRLGGGWPDEFPTDLAESLGLGLDQESYTLSADYEIFSQQADVLFFYPEYYENKTFTLVGEYLPYDESFLDMNIGELCVYGEDESSIAYVTVFPGEGITIPEGTTVCVQGVMTLFEKDDYAVSAILVNYIVPTD